MDLTGAARIFSHEITQVIPSNEVRLTNPTTPGIPDRTLQLAEDMGSRGVASTTTEQTPRVPRGGNIRAVRPHAAGSSIRGDQIYRPASQITRGGGHFLPGPRVWTSILLMPVDEVEKILGISARPYN